MPLPVVLLPVVPAGASHFDEVEFAVNPVAQASQLAKVVDQQLAQSEMH